MGAVRDLQEVAACLRIWFRGAAAALSASGGQPLTKDQILNGALAFFLRTGAVREADLKKDEVDYLKSGGAALEALAQAHVLIVDKATVPSELFRIAAWRYTGRLSWLGRIANRLPPVLYVVSWGVALHMKPGARRFLRTASGANMLLGAAEFLGFGVKVLLTLIFGAVVGAVVGAFGCW